MTDTPLRAELLALQRADLELREQLAKAGTLSDGYNDRMAALHRQHNARLRSILSEHGWPGRGLVGEDGAEAAWLVLQRAILDPELMRGAVSLVERSVRAGDTEPRCLAALMDRIRTLEGRPQLYGSQYDWDEFGDLNPFPIEDADNVDVRRASVGLEPLAERTRKLRVARPPKVSTRLPTIGNIGEQNANGRDRVAGVLRTRTGATDATYRKAVSERITWPTAPNVQESFRPKTRTQSVTTHSRANVRVV